ncbi:DUF4190 domain-containing protein [Actinomadura sp. BRA 177]|uniref:DUF4190 domain-containing protein n=1 Tax=Actinomadura sp. BRA 177 TaxID=2745202 RepID=UPI001595A86C|nr:DUF4190 domain-containing protein [Actinomadura sp. BRA 177]
MSGPPVGVRRRTNRFAIVAIVTGLLGLVLFAVGFAVAALVQIGRRGEKGTGLAIGGLAASVAWVAAVAIAVVLAGGDATGARADGKVSVTTMRPGDCFSGFEEAPAGIFVRPLPCTTPHQGEVSADGELPDMPYPGSEELRNRAWTVCRERTEFLEKSRFGHDLQLHVAPPDEEAWKDGSRTAKCVMRYTGSGLLPGPLDQTMQTWSQHTSQLAPGDCIDEWSDTGGQPLVPCTTEHEYEVLATYTLPGGEYPGNAGMEQKALRGCDKRAAKVWKGKPPSDIADISYAAPNEEGWKAGNRMVFCLVTGRNGPLKHSVVPH